MAERLEKGKVLKKWTKSPLPHHVRRSHAQLLQMKSVIRNLLSPYASRLRFIETGRKRSSTRWSATERSATERSSKRIKKS